MKPTKFPGSNVVFAENQPEYLPLPAHRDRLDPYGTVTTCWALSWLERLQVLFTGRIYLQQLTFQEALQPQLPSVERPDFRITVAEASPP